MHKDRFSFLKMLFIAGFALFCMSQRLQAQFQVNKAAFKTSDRCWTLTNDRMFEVGSVWYEKKLDLRESFDITMTVFLGCRANGADGIVFALQPVSTSVGVAGQGIGLQGVQPSIGVEFDTYRNSDFNDPPYDHITIFRDGDLNHFHSQNSLAGPVPITISRGATIPNIKDCKAHTVRFTWEAPTKKFTVYWECTVQTSVTIDLVKDVFNGDPNVFWGFTAATGGSTNEQKICLKYTSLLDRIADTVLCRGGQIQLNASGGVKYEWSPASGLSNAFIQNPIASPDLTTKYSVRITDTCGVSFNDTLTVRVGGNPFVLDLGRDTTLCGGQNLFLSPNIPDANFLWQDGSKDSTYTVTQTGVYKVAVEKNYCRAVDSVKVRFIAPPLVNLGSNATICLGKKKILTANAEEATYRWQDGSGAPSYIVTQPGLYFVTVKNQCGTAFDSMNATYQTCHNVFIPNLFSPNSDGINDVWQIFGGADVSKINSLKILNRWGKLMFEASDAYVGAPELSWDGANAANGVYAYYVTVVYTDGDTETFTGSVTVVR